MQGINQDCEYRNAKLTTNGNSFYLCFSQISNKNEIKRLCSSQFGVGCDQIIYISTDNFPILKDEISFTGIDADIYRKCERAKFYIRFFNSDASESYMCGNAMIALGTYLLMHNFKEKTAKIALPKQIVTLNLTENSTQVLLSSTFIPIVDEQKRSAVNLFLQNKYDDFQKNINFYDGVDISNPHVVFFVNQNCYQMLKNTEIYKQIGMEIEKSYAIFPCGTNVHFAFYDEQKNTLNILIWERGSGATFSCGSGIYASSYLLLRHLNFAVDTININTQDNISNLEVGPKKTTVNWCKKTGNLYLNSSAEFLFYV